MILTRPSNRGVRIKINNGVKLEKLGDKISSKFNATLSLYFSQFVLEPSHTSLLLMVIIIRDELNIGEINVEYKIE